MTPTAIAARIIADLDLLAQALDLACGDTELDDAFDALAELFELFELSPPASDRLTGPVLMPGPNAPRSAAAGDWTPDAGSSATEGVPA